MGRLSPENITDPLLRVELYRAIRTPQSEVQCPKGWTAYEILPSDITMPEKIAYRVYGLDTLKWVVMVAACMDNSRALLRAGTTLFLPSSAWIRDRIKYYAAQQGIGEN